MRVSPDGGVGFSGLDSSAKSGALAGGAVIPDGQGGVLATWFNYSSNATTVADIGTPGGGRTIFSSFPIGISSMVLGDNNTAFAINGYTAVAAFDATTLQQKWSYASTGGLLSLVAATSGGGVTINDSSQGVIQLDSSGNASTPVASLQGAQYSGNAMWLGLTGDPVASGLRGPFLLWSLSGFATPSGDAEGERQSRFDLGLVWCSNGFCGNMVDQNNSQVQDVVFSILADNPPHGTVNLTSEQIALIERNAANAFRLAFAPYNVTVDPTGRQALHTVYIGGEPTLYCGWTPGLTPGVSQVYYQKHVAEAQDAVGDDQGDPTTQLLGAIGEGIGNSAAHEVGHQLVNQYSFSGKIVNGMDLDDSSIGTYNGASCSGVDNPAVYTGYGSGGTPIHWSGNANKSLVNVFGNKN
jgi:hypothetical protein